MHLSVCGDPEMSNRNGLDVIGRGDLAVKCRFRDPCLNDQTQKT